MREGTVNKCYSFLKEMEVRAKSGSGFVAADIAEYHRCTPAYSAIAIRLGLFTRKPGKGLKANIPNVTLDHAREVLKELEEYRSRRKESNEGVGKSFLDRDEDGKLLVGIESTDHLRKSKDDKEIKVVRGSNGLRLYSDEDLINELKLRGYTGNIENHTTFNGVEL